MKSFNTSLFEVIELPKIKIGLLQKHATPMWIK